MIGIVAFTIAAALMTHFRWVPAESDGPGAPQALGEYPALTASKGVEPTAFYTPPEPLPNVAPGTVLRREPIAGAPEGVKLWRIMYMSNNNSSKPVAVTGYYAEPTLPPAQSNRYPLVAVAHGTTGVGRKCGMSQAPLESGTPGNEYWQTIVQPLTQAGYAVAVTDYEGMGAPGTPTYLIRNAQAYDVLDSLRAAMELRPQSIDASRLGIVGHSEGGFVALAAAQAVPSYAPELAVQGAVSLAPGLIPPIPAALGALVAGSDEQGGASPRTGYLAVLGWSWAATYPDLVKLDEIFTPEGLKILPEAIELCTGAMRLAFPGKLTDYVKTDLPLGMMEIASMNMPVNGVSDVPLLIQQGTEDISVVPQLSKSLLAQLCTQGGKVQYQQYDNDSHRSVQWTGRVAYLEWLNQRFANEPIATDCEGLK